MMTILQSRGTICKNINFKQLNMVENNIIQLGCHQSQKHGISPIITSSHEDLTIQIHWNVSDTVHYNLFLIHKNSCNLHTIC